MASRMPSGDAAHVEEWVVRHDSAYAGLGKESRYACATRTKLFSQGALGGKFQLKFTRQKLTLKLFVFTHIGRDHFFDLTGFKQLAQTETIYTCIVGNGCQVFNA
jgi:hypothetical protein